METKQTIGDFILQKFAGNHCIANIKGDTPYIVMTGAEITKQLILPFGHRLNKIIVRHTTALDVDSTDALSIEIRRDAGTIDINTKMKDILASYVGLTDSEYIITMGETFEYEPSTWTLAFNTTATDRIYLLIYLQQLPK